jgi:hypothetical protein
MATAQRSLTLTNKFYHEAIQLHSLSRGICREYIRKTDIHETGPDLKTRLLQATRSFNSQFNEDRVIDRLRSIDTSSDVNFMFRQTALPTFKLRLLMDDQHAAGSCDSYLAMSYRCRDPPTESPPSGYLHLPTSREVFAAVCSLVSPNEGLWFDTGCIDQVDEIDKETAISVMDIIYKNAKIVIIVLWDVQLSASEVDLLGGVREPFRRACQEGIQPHMQGYGFPPYLDGIVLPELICHPAFPGLAKKILLSEYFERAFCGQEFRVARRCSFLLRYESENSDTSLNFCTLDSSFVTTVVASLPSVLTTPPALSGLMQLEGEFERLNARMNNVQGVLIRKAYRNLAESQVGQRRALTTLAVPLQAILRGDSVCQTSADIFGMKAGGDPRITNEDLRALDANKDRLKLVFSSVEHPLTIAPNLNEKDPPLTTDRCLGLITKVALASEDALGLCGRGGKLDLGAGGSTWIQRPKRHSADNLSGPGCWLDSSMAFGLGTEGKNEYIDIGLQFLPTRPYSNSAFSNARAFLKTCEAVGVPSTFANEQNLDRTSIDRSPFKHLEDMTDIKIGTIATLFQSRDIAELSAILSTQPFSGSSHLKPQRLEAVFDEGFTLQTGASNEPSLLQSVSTALMSYVAFLLSMLQEDTATITYKNYFWRPQGALLDGHLGLVMAPPGTKLAVPDPIKWRECELLVDVGFCRRGIAIVV